MSSALHARRQFYFYGDFGFATIVGEISPKLVSPPLFAASLVWCDGTLLAKKLNPIVLTLRPPSRAALAQRAIYDRGNTSTSFARRRARLRRHLDMEWRRLRRQPMD